MALRRTLLTLLAGALALASCDPPPSGPLTVIAIGGPPRLVNPNLQPLDPPSAFLTEAVAQGLVRFDASGEIEPALAQSWIVSDDGLRYTFRIRRLEWANGDRVTAQQVVTRLRASLSRASRNPLKPVLAAISDVVAMTDEVLEIQLRGARPNFLQLLAQPEMAIIVGSQGTGPYRITAAAGPIQLAPPALGEEEASEDSLPAIVLQGARTSVAVAQFVEGGVDFATGGTLGDLAIARAANPTRNTLVYDRPNGLFGLLFAGSDGLAATPEMRRALAMAIDREGIAARLSVPGFEARTALLPAGLAELPTPVQPDWAAMPLPMRRQEAARAVAAADPALPRILRVAIPDAPGYRIVFAHLRRDWWTIGIDARRVATDAPADLRLIDAVAPANLSTWYLRFFTCAANPVCDETADAALQTARLAATPAERRTALAEADRALADLAPYIPIGTPVRWSLVSRRLTGFRANAFARHPPSELIAEEF